MIAKTLKQLWYRQIDTDGTYTLGSKFYPAAEVNAKIAELDGEIVRLRKYCFKAGLMARAPCFNCGYNGPGYFDPKTHACAKFHHKALGGGE